MKTALPNERQEMYEKNIRLLTPWLKESMTGITEEELWQKIKITYNDEGFPVCRYQKGDVCFHITGEHPVREAAAWGESVQHTGSAEIFLYGTGFGYPLFELFAHKMPHTLVIAFEQDPYLFKAMLYCFDLSPIIETQKIIFLIGDSSYFKRAFEELIYSMLFFNTTYPTVLFTLPAQRNFKAEYLEIHRYVFKELSFLATCLGNSHQDNMLGLRNLTANTKAILENPSLSCLREKYQNVPAFIVSNGPSLDRSMPLLKGIQGKGLTIAVESSIVPLTKNGIVPDILAVLERTKYTYLYHFKDRHYPPEISLLSLALADPRVFPSFSGPKIPIFRKGEELNRWFNRNLGDGSALDAGVNVSHLAAGIAMYLGADPIIFVGQDFAYGPGGATHSRDAVASQGRGKRARNFLHSLPTVFVEGNSGEMIPSNRLWQMFRIGLERIIAEHPEHRFYNATDGGAKILGTERAELGRLIEKYCTAPIPCRVNEVIAESRAKISAAERKASLEKFTAEMGSYAVRFRKLAQEMNARRLECEKMLRLSSGQVSEQGGALLDETYLKNISFVYECLDDNLFRSFFQQLIFAYFHLLDRLETIDTPEKRTRVFDIQRQFFRDLLAVSQSLAVSLEEGTQSLKDLLEELRGKAE